MSEILNELQTIIKQEDNETKIIELKNIFIKQHLHPMQEKIKNVSSVEEKKNIGMEINNLKTKVDELVNERLQELKSDVKQNDKQLYSNININVIKSGRKHLINKVIDDIIDYLKGFNFKLVSGNEITSDFYNFTALNIPEDHPARNMHDSLFLANNYLLRTHCTANSAQIMKKFHNEQDLRIFSYGNVYRKDEDDATHSHQFTQVDLIWARSDLSLANLKFLINGLINHIFEKELNTRYRLSYFPFTEPSFEVDVACWKCNQKGCNICKQSGWIEILGAGMLNQAVIENVGIKNITTALAAGIGIERIAMLKYNISDIRDLYNNDFDIIKQFPEE